MTIDAAFLTMREHCAHGNKAYARLFDMESDAYIGLIDGVIDEWFGCYYKGSLQGFVLLYKVHIDNLPNIHDWIDRDDWQIEVERIM